MGALSEFEQDMLRELLNVGIGRAAYSLSRMLDEEIVLSAPFLKVLSRQEATELIQNDSDEPVAAVRQSFDGPFQGSALLIYHENTSLELVRRMLKEEVPLATLTELEQESLMEVGNVILNACLGSIANMLGGELRCDLPEYLKGRCETLLQQPAGRVSPALDGCGGSECILLMYVDFSTGGDSLKGYLALLLDMVGMTRLRGEMSHLMERYAG
ncbi:MAG: chemotaxis protein CheC [Magnetococcales bacterium]|nr:chemotaxis protein CheC [Magnetococcales bacterium]